MLTKSISSTCFVLVLFFILSGATQAAKNERIWCDRALESADYKTSTSRDPAKREQLNLNISMLQDEIGPSYQLNGYWGPDSLMWKIAANPLLPIMGTKTLYLQLAQPAAAQGVADHSERLANEIVERFQSTFNYLWRMIYGNAREAEGIAKGLFNRHSKITGIIPVTAGAYQAGDTYSANDPEAALWVAETFLIAMKESYEIGNGPLSRDELEQFAQEGRRFAMLFGVPEERIPRTWNELQQYYNEVIYGGELEFTPDARMVEQHHRSIVLQPGITKIGRRFAVGYIDALTADMLPSNVARDLGLKRGIHTKLTATATRMTMRQLYRQLPEWAREHPMARLARARVTGVAPNPRDEVAYKLMVGQLPLELRTLLALSWPDVFSARELAANNNHHSNVKPNWSGAGGKKGGR